MPIARFQLPDGRIARFEVPEGTTPDQAQSLIQTQLPSLLGQVASAPTTPTAPARPERTWGQALGDFGVQLGEGANTLVGAIPGLLAPESDATKFFERGAEYWREKQSEPLKQRMAAADVSIKKAGEEGIKAQIVEAASQYYDDPALAARFVITNLPSMIPGLGATKLAQAAALAKGATAAKAAGVATTTGGAVNAILNAGGARAEAFEDIKKTLIAQGYSPAEAERKAIEDSRLVAAVGGATGFISGKTGLEKAISGGVTKGGLRGVAGRVAGELAGEQIEEVAPKFATNVQAAEYDARSLGKDIGRTIVETGIASGPGAALSGVMGGARPEAPTTGETPPASTTPTGETPSAPEMQEIRDRLAARGFSEEDIESILAERAARAAAKIEEPTDAIAATPPADVPAATELEPGVGESGVGVPSGDLGRPTTAEPAAPVGGGLERPVVPPAPRVEPEAPIPTELTETPSGTQAPETIQAKEEGSAQPAAPAPTAVETPATEPKVTFKTELGSAYSAFPDGTTQRVKAERNLPGHEGDKGAKERSVRTVYLDSEASALSAAGVTYPEGAKPRVILKDGTATLTWITNGKRGSAKSGTKVPFYTEPAVGRFPLELWQPRKDVPGFEAYAGTHAGNKIVEINTPTAPVEEKPARFQTLRAEQPWYSALDKAIEASPQKAAPAPQWKNVLTGMVNKGQAKRDEIEWTGVEDWLALQQGRVTKEQVQDYLKQGGVKVEETVLGENKDALSRIRAEWANLPEAEGYSLEYDSASENYEYVKDDDNVDFYDLPPKLQETVNKHLSNASSDTKYSTFTLPGGENYREVLLRLPTKPQPVDTMSRRELADWYAQEVGYDPLEDDPEITTKDLRDLVRNANSENGAVRAANVTSEYRSSHWDQPNVLAHIRVNDRTDADGKKVLFVEEIQSDWGQGGKKQGFKGPPLTKAEKERYAALTAQIDDTSGTAEDLTPAERAEFGDLSRRTDGAIGVPPAPFVTKTEGWLNLALKRVLTMAAEGGYDRVAFTTGDQNAERYDLSKQVDHITYEPTSKGYNINVTAGGQNVKQGNFTRGELEDIVGKEIVQKMDAREGKQPFDPEIEPGLADTRELSGLDLKVGGEGMKTFYDQIIPNALNKLLPKVGGGKAGTITFPGTLPGRAPSDRRRFLDWMATNHPEVGSLSLNSRFWSGLKDAFVQEWLQRDLSSQQPGFDITPAMREKLAGGLPLFQKDEDQSPQTTGKYPLPAQAVDALKNNDLTAALDAIENSKPSEINKAIAARVKSLLKNTQVTIDDDLRGPDGKPVLGAASTSGRRVWLDVNRGMNMETVLHESVHAATERILSTPEDQRTPEQNAAVQELTDLWEAAKTNGVIKLTPEASDSLSEFVAEGLTNIELQDQLASVKWESKTMWQGFKRILLNMLGIKTPASMLDYTLASVDTIFAAVPTAPTSTPAQTTTKPEAKVLQKPKLTAEEKAKKDAEEADAKVTEALEKFAKSKTSEEAAKAASTLQSLRSSKTTVAQLQRLYDSVSDKAKRVLVQAPPTDFLAEWASKNVPELQRTTELLSRMSGMTEQLLHGASQTSDRISRAFNKDPLLRARLEKVVYVSTLAQIDPATNKINPELNVLYKGLGEEGQAIFKEVRDYYSDMGDLYSQLIKDNIDRSGASEESKSAILAKLKVLFEPANRMRPYFPLMRRGDFWFSSGKGKDRRFHMFESMPERDAALEAFARSEGTPLQAMKETSEVKFGNDVSSLRELDSSTDKTLSDVLALVEKLDTGSATSKKELLDSVYQLYLHSLPEQSFRKHYITREGVAGFSTDFLRNFSQSAIQMSGQLARVKYGSQIRSSLLSAKASIENQPQYEPYVEEMTKRAELSLMPPAHTKLDDIANIATRVSYIHYLSGLSSALLQPLGILQTGINVLGARHGYLKSMAQIGKLMLVWNEFGISRKLPDGSSSYVFPTIANSKAINASQEEKRAINEMLARDVSQSTMSRELYGYRTKPTDRVNTAGDKGAKVANLLLGGLMHHTERLSREIMYLASYRLSRAEGKSHAAAVNAAVKDTQDSLGNYSQYGRPRIMRNPVGKVALQFSTYPLHIASFLGSNFYKMMPLLNKEGKAEAAKIFFGTLGTTWILAGAAGFPAPVSAVLMGFISFMFSLLSDDEEMPEELRKQNFTKWFNTVWLPEQLGPIKVFGQKLSDIVTTGPLSSFTGWDFSSRLGINNLFLREQKETKSPRDDVTALVMEEMGPSINMLLSYADGVQAFKEGDYQRGVEKFVPAAARNILQAFRFDEEGAKDIKGIELITQGDFTTGELIGRAIGFQPSKLANLQKVNAEVKQETAKMDNARNLILRKLDIAKRKDADIEAILEEKDAYNAKYPTNAISGSDIAKYLKDKAKERAESQQGVAITKKTPAAVREMIDLSR